MAKIDSTTSSGAQLDSSDDASSGALDIAKAAGEKMLESGVDTYAQLVPFSKDDLVGSAKDAYEWAAHSSELGDLSKQLQKDPKKALASMSDAEASWVLRSLSDGDKSKVADAFVRSGMTKQVTGESSPSGAPKPPALYELKKGQPQSVQDFLHQQNVRAARDYDEAYDRYAAANPGHAEAPAMVSEPGGKGALDASMTLGIAKNPLDYVSGKIHDAQNSFNVEKQASRLAQGDELQMQVGADLAVDGAAGGVSMSLKVKREADGYHVSPMSGGTVGATIDDGGNQKVAVGGYLGGEYRCATPAEAQRVASLMAKCAKSSTLSPEDSQFLDSRLVGVDLKGSGALKFSAEITKDSGLKVGAGLKSETSMHFDLESKTLTVSQKFSADTNLQRTNLTGTLGKSKLKASSQSDGGLSGDVTVTKQYKLPNGVSARLLLTDTNTALAAVALGSESDTAIKIRVQRGSDHAKAVTVESKHGDANAVLDTFNSSGLNAAVTKLATSPGTSVKLDETKTEGVDQNQKVGSSLTSFGLNWKSVRVSHQVKSLKLDDALASLRD